ncbi:hypothetical protein [Aquimarina agarivorans]|uniref:hypothetical protein n=1 Tax=Aquimarina agarivorans TaxID=980584 RepID=UPI000248EDB1|nr:hypothetical protein [Aquimarina agarivorans]
MQKTTLSVYMIFLSSFVFAQKYIDMTAQLSNIEGNLVIDGNILKKEYDTREEIIITGKNMIVQDKSGFVFNNVIIQLSGGLIVEAESHVYPKILDSYIFCKYAEGITSKNIIQRSNLKHVNLQKVKYLKKITGNPEIWIFDRSGKSVYKGLKNEINDLIVPIARYDVKIKGRTFDEAVLFY